MKVLQITNLDFPVSRGLKHGATQRVVYALAQQLGMLGVDVTVCCTSDSDELGGSRYSTATRALASPPDRPVASFYTHPAEYERHFELSLARAIDEQVDVIHDHHSRVLLSEAYRRRRSLLSMPILTTLHGAVFYDHHLLECAAYTQLAGPNIFFNCVSKHQAKLWAQYINIGEVIHNGIFANAYHLERQKKDYLFNLGRIMWRKGQDIAVQVAETTGLKLVLAGPIIEPDYFEQFRSRVTMMPEISTIAVTPSYVEEVVDPVLACPGPAVYIGELDDMQKDLWFGHARCFLMPVRWDEPFGLVLLESMACGTPVIAFNRGGVSEIVIDKKTGFLVNSADEMVDCVRRVSEIDPLECRMHVEKHFSSRAMALRYMELYKELDNLSPEAECADWR